MSAPFQNRGENLEFVPEYGDEFLRLFPHRWNFLYAKHPKPGQSPKWYAEGRYPLSDRQIQQGDYLYGVRFGKQTNYCLIDLDPTSSYHPKSDPLAVTRMMDVLEQIGLLDYLPLQSSYRGGVHIYLPFDQAQPPWAIAQVIQVLLERAGFTFNKGQLEIFPNPRTFTLGSLPLYSAHRLPLQAGSYLLDEGWNPIRSTQTIFVNLWRQAQCRNELDTRTIKRIRRQVQRTKSRVSDRGQKLLDDLNADIEPGWTGAGQTNFILGRIAYRERVFHHVLHGGEPLTIQELAKTIVEIAQSLPGYEEFCNHKPELEERAREWALSAQRHYPYSSGCGRRHKQDADGHHSGLTWNQRQAEAAKRRIKEAMTCMMVHGSLPMRVKSRLEALKKHGIGSDALYRNKALWHPEFLEPLS